MPITDFDEDVARSPLERFLRDYVAAAGGVWDEVEPQVYDVLLPEAADAAVASGRDPAILRLTFEPEALPEHPHSQLASLGTPLVDRMLGDAVHRGRFVELHLIGLNLQPHGIESRIARSITLMEGLALELHRIRPLDFPQAVFWFEATFTSDQREQEILSIAIDLHYGRQVRRLDALLDASRLVETPSILLPAAPGVGRAAACRTAREQVVRTVTSLANTRARELSERLARQIARMTRYYDDLQQELIAQAARAASRQAGDEGKHQARREALVRERDLRIVELRKKSTLGVRLRLLNVLVVHQPKLQVQASLVETETAEGKRAMPPSPMWLVWDPLVEALEAVPCGGCGRPTFELARRATDLACPACVASTPPGRRTAPPDRRTAARG